FAGYPFFEQYLRLQKIKPWYGLPAGLRKMAAGLALGSSMGRKGRMKQLLGLPSPSISHSYPIFRQILSPLLIHKFTHLSGDQTLVEKELEQRHDRLMKLPLLSQVSAAEYLGYTQQTLLKDTDQMSMAVSLEVREPFFDHDLVEFVLSIPDEIKRPVYPKSLLVESLKPLLPDEVVFRPKKGFLFPWELWIRNELRSFCEDRINNMASRSLINGDALITYWKRFLSGDKDTRWAEIWLFVVLEHWLERNNIL
ncbi:MAG TPA: asparagine synthase-related protein, partial [Puia sp.]|nr:asparagine synthase-related protein [Puia sp.]